MGAGGRAEAGLSALPALYRGGTGAVPPGSTCAVTRTAPGGPPRERWADGSHVPPLGRGRSRQHQWFTVLSAARKAGVSFLVTDGHRTLAQQQAAWNLYQHGGHSPRFPNPTAPHIRDGTAGPRARRQRARRRSGPARGWLRKRGAQRDVPCRARPGTSKCRATTSCGWRGSSPIRSRLPGEGAAVDPQLRRTHAPQARGQRSGRRAGAAQRAAPRMTESAQVDLASRTAVGLGPHAAPCPVPLAARTNPQPRLKEPPPCSISPGPPARHHRRPARRRRSWPACRASPRCWRRSAWPTSTPRSRTRWPAR